MGASRRRTARLFVVSAVAVTALVPLAGAEAVTRPQTLLDQRPATAGMVEPGFPIDHLGVVFDLPPGEQAHHDHDGEAHPGVVGQVAVRLRSRGAWGPWLPVGEDGAQAVGQWTGALVPSGDAEAYQVRGIPTSARWTRVAAINTTDGPTEVVGHRPRGAAEASTPCRSRADWGADETIGSRTRSFAPLQVVTVHHTAGENDDPDPAATLRAIHRYHVQTNAWDDIGYQTVIGPDGIVYEGRWSGTDSVSCLTGGGDGRDFGHETRADDAAIVTGAHAGGHNTGNLGVALLGTYTDVAPPAATRAALVAHLAEVAGRHGLDPLGQVAYDNGVNAKSLPAILGHRDVTATECPGGILYADLPAIRQDVASALAPGDEPTPAPTRVTASAEWTTSGTVQGTIADTWVLDGAQQVLTEAVTGGKPALRTSTLEHTWQVDEVAATPAVVEVSATTPTSSDGDRFALEVSGDGGTSWTRVLVLPAASTGTWGATLPAITGTVLVRVTDTDRSAGSTSADSLAVDHLVIRWDGASTTTPMEPEPEPEPEPSPEPTKPGKRPKG